MRDRCAVTHPREKLSRPRQSRAANGKGGLRGRGVPRREWKWKGGGEEELSPAANGRCVTGAALSPTPREILFAVEVSRVPRREWKGGEEPSPAESRAANGMDAGARSRVPRREWKRVPCESRERNGTVSPSPALSGAPEASGAPERAGEGETVPFRSRDSHGTLFHSRRGTRLRAPASIPFAARDSAGLGSSPPFHSRRGTRLTSTANSISRGVGDSAAPVTHLPFAAGLSSSSPPPFHFHSRRGTPRPLSPPFPFAARD